MDSSQAPAPTRSRLMLTVLVAFTFIVAGSGLAVVLLGDRSVEVDVIDYGSGVDVQSVPDPYAAGEELPPGYFQIYSRDIILPVYAPQFTSASAIGWPDDADVIGVAVNGEAKAYPVSFLNGREMVIDELGGEPLLVSW